jgi:hypothetical protein
MSKVNKDNPQKHVSDGGLLSSPLVQSGLLGALGYWGSGQLYDYLANNKWQSDYIRSIRDPQQRSLMIEKLRAERDRKRKNWQWGTAGVMASLPILNNASVIKKGWSKGAEAYGGPTIGEDTVGGIGGALSAIIGGEKAVRNMPSTAKAVDGSTYAGMGKGGSESRISTTFDKQAGMFDALSNVSDDQLMTPPTLNTSPVIPVSSSIALLNNPANVNVMGPTLTSKINEGLIHGSNGLGAGVISISDTIHGLTRAGFGYKMGSILGNTLGDIFAQPYEIKKKLSNTGAMGGAILNSIGSYIFK